MVYEDSICGMHQKCRSQISVTVHPIVLQVQGRAEKVKYRIYFGGTSCLQLEGRRDAVDPSTDAAKYLRASLSVRNTTERQ
jgi:hypothetical protein